MEHSALHALLLTGLIAALGGAFAMWGLFGPAARGLGLEKDVLMSQLEPCVARWVFRAALLAAVASSLDFFVQVAEFEGRTVFGGVDVAMVGRFATRTTVGQLTLLRIGLLLLTAWAARPRARHIWAWILILALGAVLAASLVSHAAAQPDRRIVAISVQIVHLLAASGWIGVLLHLFAARKILLAYPPASQTPLIAEIVRRFSPVALATTTLLAITGLLAAWRFLGATGALFSSAYGLTLLVKLTLLVPALVAGWVNFRHIRPRLLGAVEPAPVLSRFGRMLELEITAGVLVIAVAGILGSISPPGDDGSLQLTRVQLGAVLTPDLPTTRVENWTLPEDPRGPTIDDLRYSEFTHNWSGILVTLLGLCWLAQATGGRLAWWAERTYPFLLLPFGCFIAVAANPELWLLQFISPWEALTNPAILEHQLGALLVFVLAWFSWRDRRHPEHLRPLGYTLPVIMIAGSLLLLGHAHSALAVPDELTNLINVQHAILGSFGLLGGTARWFVLRGLIPPRAGNFLWPGSVIALGVFMAFFYREVT